MDFITPMLEIVKLSWTSCARQVKYVKDLEENVKILEKKMDELISLENDVRIEVDRATLQLRNPKNVVNNWLKNVQEMRGEVTDIGKQFRENKRCLKGCFPHYCSRRELGKRTLSKIVAVDELKKECPFKDGVAVDPLPEAVRLLPTTNLVGKSAEMAIKRIWDCLMDKEMGIIGVHGMGGVGKTTIMKTINNRLKDTTLFNTVIWLTVSKNFTLKTLQDGIAEKMEFHFPEEMDEEGRSAKLHEALLCRKKFVLILDDMWNPIALEDVGIPRPGISNGCKVVLTTRLVRVCQQMETEQNIEVEVLSREDAWTLFQEKVGIDVLLDADVQDVAKQVADECGGLPLVIITVGRAFRGINDVGEWRHALNQLTDSTMEVEGMEEGVFRPLKFSYDHLRNEVLRACFLYCSLYPEDKEIYTYDLIDRWIREGLVGEMRNRQDEIDNGTSILNELKRAHMLESNTGNDTVKMHDSMRDMAIVITRDSPRFMVKAGIGLEEAPSDKEWVEGIERISLMTNNIKNLSSQPKCPALLTLFLNHNPLRQIHDSFFQYMHKLHILDLSETYIKVLPESLSCLENLRELSLRSCSNLKMLPSLTELNELRELNLSGTYIEELPESLSDLENLRGLKLRGCKKLRTLPALGKLKKLSNLNLSATCFEELPESLSNLENLYEIKLSDCKKLKMVPSLAKLKKLRALELRNTSIEELPEGMEGLVELRTLDLRGSKKIKMFPDKILPKLSHLENFWMASSLCLWSSNETLTIEGRIRIEELATLTRLRNVYFIFANLPSLSEYIGSLKGNILKMKSFNFDVAMPKEDAASRGVGYLLALGYNGNLEIKECHNIIQLSHFLLDLGVLEIIELRHGDIRSCNGMECLLSVQDDNNNSNLLFAQLEKLELRDLLNFRSLHRGTVLHGTLASLKVLEIYGCPKLKNLFPLKLLQELHNLEKIDVSYCNAMEEVGEGGHRSNNDASVVTLNRLQYLRLSNLPSLKSICSRVLVCYSLQSIVVSGCPQLKRIPLQLDIDKLPPDFEGLLEGTRPWWDALEWVDLNHSKALERFFLEDF